MIRKYTSSQSEIQCNSASTSILNTRVYTCTCQDQAASEADRGSGEGGISLAENKSTPNWETGLREHYTLIVNTLFRHYTCIISCTRAKPHTVHVCV